MTFDALSLVKPIAAGGYAGYGAFLIRAAVGMELPQVSVPRWLTVSVVAAMTSLLLFRFSQYGLLFPAAVAAVIAVFAIEGNWRSLPGELAIVVSGVSLAWWLKGPVQPDWRWRIAVLAFIVWCIQAGFNHPEQSPGGSSTRAYIAVFGIAGLALIANMSPYSPGANALSQLLAHQGAYIGPALHVRAGLAPFYDIPLQYGLGPTLAIVAGCGITNCWSATQFLTVATTVLMGLLVLKMSLATAKARGWRWKAAATGVIFCAMFLWPGFPDEGSIRAALPGGSGMRFLPVVLVSFLLFFGRSGWAAVALIPAVLWSPEVGCMSIVVFGTGETARIGFARAAAKTASIAAGSLLALLFAHRMWYGVWIQPDVMAEYLLHVPAPLPIHLLTDFTFLIAALALAAWLLYRRASDPGEFRRDLIAASLLFACASYYLGRSHPNNVCSLMPFVALVGMRGLERPAVSRVAVVGLATATAAISLSLWTYAPFANWSTGHPAFVSPDREVAAIRAQIVNPLHEGIADLGTFRIRNPAETIVWTPLDPSSLWGDNIPAERIQLYVKRSAARLNLPGWVVVADEQQYLLNDLRTAYRVTEETRHGAYTVAHLTPFARVDRAIAK